VRGRPAQRQEPRVLSVYLAALCDWSADLALGERGVALFLASTERQAAIAHRYSAGAATMWTCCGPGSSTGR